ncbi:hypothetical protein GGP62_003214 [Salinibacter ruber]|uniref:hypothetical protein n=1 Tax=Salinibacter ruber TaxID=146919 RepID=UPI00216747A1|nr:hypothetical protein [Salinibacter ruber]MCS3708304.1 hypothetical protein [Salinibacter ruber]
MCDREVRLIHIAPELPPAVGGVADYTAILTQRLVEVSDGAVEPVLVHAGRQEADIVDADFPVVDLSGQCSAQALTDTLREQIKRGEKNVVLLEYANYGYSAKGIPVWLIRGLNRVCRRGGVPLITMMHELYATGPPWSGAFWYTGPQQVAAVWLARLSRHVVSNREDGVQWLDRYRQAKKDILVQPVFSNVGEPDTLPPFERRSSRVVVFGGGNKKSQIYRQNNDLLRALSTRHGYEEIDDIGPSASCSDPSTESVTFHGVLPAATISEKMRAAGLGLLAYPSERLAKSGGGAAFAAHGLPFVLLDETPGGDASPYEEGTHFWRWSTLSASPGLLDKDRLAGMSRALRALYKEHMHSRVAARRLAQMVTETIASTNATATS